MTYRDPDQAVLSIRLLGAPVLERHQQPLAISRRKSRALIYYVAEQTVPVRRDQVLALFWPDLERAAAQQTLRTTVHGLRKMIGAQLETIDDTLSLAAETMVDVRQLSGVLASAPVTPALPPALELYRGDFLADFSLPDLSEFDDWTRSRRAYYRQLAMRGWARLARHYEARHAYDAALDALGQIGR